MSEMKGRQWAEKVLAAPPRTYSPGEVAAAKVVVEHTAPLSMAYVNWDDEKHHLAGATTDTGKDVVMMWYDPKHTDHIISDRDEWRREQLTPNGKKYELREVTDEDEHLKVLSTEEDYANAPEGTVVADATFPDRVSIKRNINDWSSYVEHHCTSNAEMAQRGSATVMRWGRDRDE